jgi:hypothetical protein
MDKTQELAELLLPEGILEYFDYEGYTKEKKVENTYGEVTIILVEKNVVENLFERHIKKVFL